LCCDRGIHLTLASATPLPPGRVQLLSHGRPAIIRRGWHLPILPLLPDGVVEFGANGVETLPPTLPDYLNLAVVRYRPESDVRHTLANKSVPDVPLNRVGTWRSTSDLRLLLFAI